MTSPKKVRKKNPRLPIAWRTVKDENGNNMLLGNNTVSIKVKLKLANEGKKRNIGTIMIKKRELVVKRKRDKHLYYTTNSYGFNHKLLDEAKMFDTVRLSDELAEYKMPRTFILENGNFLLFKKQGFELQIFLPLSDMEQFKVQPKF